MQCVMSQTTVIVSLCDLCKKYCLQYEKTPFLAKKTKICVAETHIRYVNGA